MTKDKVHVCMCLCVCVCTYLDTNDMCTSSHTFLGQVLVVVHVVNVACVHVRGVADADLCDLAGLWVGWCVCVCVCVCVSAQLTKRGREGTNMRRT
jgi:hypothetical protein